MKNPALLAALLLGAASFDAFSTEAFAQRSLAVEVPTARQLARFGLERAWASQATIEIGRDVVRHVVLDEDSLYVQSSGGTVTAFDNETGRKRWALQLGSKDEPSYAVTSNEEMVLVIAGIHMYAIEKFGGDLLWTLQMNKQPSTSPVMDGDQVYFGSLDGSVHAYDLKKIHELHDQDRLPQWTNVAYNWRYKSAKEVTSPPVVGGGLVHFASRDNSLYAITAGTRKLQWQFETHRPISANLGESNGVLFLASEDFNVFCIDKITGSIRWQFIAVLPLRVQPRVINEDVYVFPHRGGMHCLSRVSGRRKYWRPNLVDFVGATRRLLFASDSVNNLVVMSRLDGATIGALPFRGFTHRLGNELTDRMYIATQSGLVVCIREIGQEFPTYHAYPDRQPILPEFAPEEPEDPAADPNVVDPNAPPAATF